MKTNVAIELDDTRRNRLAVLFDGKQTARKVTRKEVCAFVQACIDTAVEAHYTDAGPKPGPTAAGERITQNVVIPDINAGAWSFIDG